jgi:hypothetical protein
VITLTDTSGPSTDDLPEPLESETIVLKPEGFLNPQVIGHTGDINFWNTLLMVVLLVGTFRDTILHNKKRS